jgi:hypothetical protein
MRGDSCRIPAISNSLEQLGVHRAHHCLLLNAAAGVSPAETTKETSVAAHRKSWLKTTKF